MTTCMAGVFQVIYTVCAYVAIIAERKVHNRNTILDLRVYMYIYIYVRHAYRNASPRTRILLTTKVISANKVSWLTATN